MSTISLQSHPEESEIASPDYDPSFLPVSDIVETTELCKLINWCKAEILTPSTSTASLGRVRVQRDCQTLEYTSAAACGTIDLKTLRVLSIVVPDSKNDEPSQLIADEGIFSFRMKDDSGLEIELSGGGEEGDRNVFRIWALQLASLWWALRITGPEGYLPRERSQPDTMTPIGSPFPTSLQPREELQHVLEFVNTQADGHRIATDVLLDAVDLGLLVSDPIDISSALELLGTSSCNQRTGDLLFEWLQDVDCLESAMALTCALSKVVLDSQLIAQCLSQFGDILIKLPPEGAHQLLPSIAGFLNYHSYWLFSAIALIGAEENPQMHLDLLVSVAHYSTTQPWLGGSEMILALCESIRYLISRFHLESSRVPEVLIKFLAHRSEAITQVAAAAVKDACTFGSAQSAISDAIQRFLVLQSTREWPTSRTCVENSFVLLAAGDLVPFLTMRGYIGLDLAYLITRNVEEMSFADAEAPLETRINLGTMRLLLEGQRALSSVEALPIASLADTCMEDDVARSGSSVDEDAEDEILQGGEHNSPSSAISPVGEFVPGSELRRISGRRILPKIDVHGDSKKKAITAVKKMKQIAKGALAMMDQ